MPPPRAPGRVARARQRRSERRTRRFAALVLVTSVLVVTLALTAFGTGASERVSYTGPAKRLLPDGPPRPEIVAVRGTLRLQLPITQGRVTAIGYHAAAQGALTLDPLGKQGNRGLFRRLLDKVFGSGAGGLLYYDLDGGDRPSSSLDVGAAPGTDVYSPVDGTIIGITDYVLNERRYGVRVDVQPFNAPSLVVSITRLRPDSSLTVGSTVSAATSRLGAVLDLSAVERQALARYTQDAGNHVSLEVRPAATLTLP